MERERRERHEQYKKTMDTNFAEWLTALKERQANQLREKENKEPATNKITDENRKAQLLDRLNNLNKDRPGFKELSQSKFEEKTEITSDSTNGSKTNNPLEAIKTPSDDNVQVKANIIAAIAEMSGYNPTDKQIEKLKQQFATGSSLSETDRSDIKSKFNTKMGHFIYINKQAEEITIKNAQSRYEKNTSKSALSSFFNNWLRSPGTTLVGMGLAFGTSYYYTTDTTMSIYAKSISLALIGSGILGGVTHSALKTHSYYRTEDNNLRTTINIITAQNTKRCTAQEQLNKAFASIFNK
jgi:hypothetical protein